MRRFAIRALMSGAAFLSVWPALAQEQPPVETVVVTGTRIPRPAYDLPSPVATMSAEEIQHSGTTNLADYLKRVPSLAGSLGDFQTSGYNTPVANDLSSLGGLNLLDLRNLGYVRTLVLIDGHRTVSESTGSAAVDIDSIPISITDRVDVTTGGASAVYGADGVSGVVNFIMKHDLDGVHARVQMGTSAAGGGGKFMESLAVGHNFDDDKGNVTIVYENTNQEHLYFTQRDFTDVGGFTSFVPNPLNKHDTLHLIPDFIPTNDAQFIFSAPTGAITTDFDKATNKKKLPNWLGNGDPFDIGTYLGGGVAIGSDGMPFAQDLQGDFQPIARRNIAQIESKYEFSNYFRLTGSFQFAGVDTKSKSYPTFDDSTVILPDNAFIADTVRDAILLNKQQQGLLREDYLQLRNAEEVKRNTYRASVDLAGDIPNPSFLDKTRYDLSFVYGRTDVDDIQIGNRIEDRFFAALDSVIDPATGKATCRSNLDPSAGPPDLHKIFKGFYAYTDTDTLDPSQFPFTFTTGPNSGCVPFNPFDPGYDNRASIAFMTTDTHIRGAISQSVLNGFVSADVPVFESLGFAHPLSIVMGGEYRREQSDSNPDALSQSNLVWIGGVSPVHGAFEVEESFAEASLPIFEDKPFAKELSIEGAVRQSHYSTAGDSTSWKYGGIWSPIDGLKFRATNAVAVRAPNIGELFAPEEHGFAFVADPCDKLYIHLGTDFRIPNCQAIEDALLGPGHYTAGQTSVQSDQSIPNVVGGNTHLLPETARTLTAGIVVQPKAVPGLEFSIDWYQVHIANAIQAPSAQSVSDECVDLSIIANPFCAAVTRTATGNFPGSISQVVAQEINVASFGTDGVDLSLTYHLDTKDVIAKDWGGLDFHLIGSWLDSLSTVPLPGEKGIESANTFDGGVDGSPAPRAQANLDIVWTLDKFTVDYNIDWYNGVLAVERQTVESEPDVYAQTYLHLPDRFVHSIQVDYAPAEGWDVYAGIDNLFDQQPALGQNGLPAEPLGRFVYVGVKADLGFADLGL
ncbi:MAG TPA: TonB-dependent receptor [Rhizomicrobium sp.]|nr:TonB-dependent receptor [Rhizomicrobium sp.]